MPNFAQEVPCLLFLPFFILSAIMFTGGMIHLAIQFEAKISARRAATGSVLDEKPALVVSLRQQASQLKIPPAGLRPLSTKI